VSAAWQGRRSGDHTHPLSTRTIHILHQKTPIAPVPLGQALLPSVPPLPLLHKRSTHTCGSITSSMAMATRLRSPPDTPLTPVPLSTVLRLIFVRPRESMTDSTRALTAAGGREGSRRNAAEYLQGIGHTATTSTIDCRQSGTTRTTAELRLVCWWRIWCHPAFHPYVCTQLKPPYCYICCSCLIHPLTVRLNFKLSHCDTKAAKAVSMPPTPPLATPPPSSQVLRTYLMHSFTVRLLIGLSSCGIKPVTARLFEVHAPPRPTPPCQHPYP
jgi:hypothetical protein